MLIAEFRFRPLRFDLPIAKQSFAFFRIGGDLLPRSSQLSQSPLKLGTSCGVRESLIGSRAAPALFGITHPDRPTGWPLPEESVIGLDGSARLTST